MIRVLISIAPRSYRESLAIVLQRDRPEADVRVSPPERVEQEVHLFEPHMLICNDEAYPTFAGIVHSIVEILIADDLHANISVNGHEKTIRDVSIADLLKVLDETGSSVTGMEPELPRE